MPDTQLSTDAVTNTDINSGETTDTLNNDDDVLSNTNDALSNADETAWCLILVNKWNYIPDDYEVELMELSNGQTVDKRIYPALQEMFDAARSIGVYKFSNIFLSMMK